MGLAASVRGASGAPRVGHLHRSLATAVRGSGLPQTHSGSWDGIPVQSINGKSGILTSTDLNLTAVNGQSLVNVQSFGTVGDGVADDTAAVQAAIDSVAGSNGGAVYFPPGFYRLTSPLSASTRNLTLFGNDGASGQWPKVANGNTVIFTPTGAGGFNFNVNSGITVFAGPTISNLCFSPPYVTVSGAQTLGTTLTVSSSQIARLPSSGTAIIQDKHQVGVFTYTSKSTNQLLGITVGSETVPGATYSNSCVVTAPSQYGVRLSRVADFHIERCTFMHYADTTPSILLDDAIHSLTGATGLIVDGSLNVAQYGTVMNSRFYGCYRGAQEYLSSTRWVGGDFDSNLNGSTPWTNSIGWYGQQSSPCTFYGVSFHGADVLWQGDGGASFGCRHECWKTAAVNLVGAVRVTYFPATLDNFQAGVIGTGIAMDAASTKNLVSVLPAVSVGTRFTDAGSSNTVIDSGTTGVAKLSGSWSIVTPSTNTGTGLSVTTQDTATGSQGVSITCATGGGTAAAHALTANLTGSGNSLSSAINAVSANSAASAVQVTGHESGRGSIKVAHLNPGPAANSDANASALSIDLQNGGQAGTAAQGIFIDSTTGGTTGALLNVKNNGNQLLKVVSDGTFSIPSVVLGNGGPQITMGVGVPAVSAPVGSLYLRTDGTAGATLYVKESGTGTAGWVAK